MLKTKGRFLLCFSLLSIWCTRCSFLCWQLCQCRGVRFEKKPRLHLFLSYECDYVDCYFSNQIPMHTFVSVLNWLLFAHNILFDAQFIRLLKQQMNSIDVYQPNWKHKTNTLHIFFCNAFDYPTIDGHSVVPLHLPCSLCLNINMKIMINIWANYSDSMHLCLVTNAGVCLFPDNNRLASPDKP